MLNRVSAFFKNLNSFNANEASEIIPIEIACAVLLCEVMRADHNIDSAEQNKLTELLTHRFNLNAQETLAIINSALIKSADSNDLYTYTSLINKHYQIAEKIQLVELLWQIALADGEISAIEHHIIRKIADLLHLRHSEYVASKPSVG
ncbi:MAG: TerB family tellurite resistance protein [Thalassotalea sp.]